MRRLRVLILAMVVLGLASVFYAQDEGAQAEEADSAGLAAYNTYVIQSGDTLYAIARRFNTTIAALSAINSISDIRRIRAGQVLLAPIGEDGSAIEYVVQSGDSLSSIARRFHTSVRELQAMNALGDNTVIFTGQRLFVPLDGGAPADEGDVEAVEGDVEADEPSAEPQLDDARFTSHVVESGDTLYDLSRRYNTTVAQLRSINGIEGRTDLIVGESLLVPRLDETLLERYVVQSGDSLYAIARRNDIELQVLQVLNRLADIRDLRADQVLLLPRLEGRTLTVHVIQAGDTLDDLAEAYHTTVAALQSLNGIADASLLARETAIIVPAATDVLARPGFGYGLQVFIDRSRAGDLAATAVELGVDWVKLDVSWAEIETAPEIYSYSALDLMVAAMELAGLKIMLNVYDAPEWSRSAYTAKLNSQFRDYSGPPADYDDFARFLANLVIRYAGLVDAYEIWKSPNLLKYWAVPVYTRPQAMTADGDYGVPDEIQMGARYYAPLLELAYNTIKAHDGEALVVAAGLAPVGFNDNYNSIDTVTFLNNMLAAGAAAYSDAIGAIFSASAVPPTLACCDKPPGVDTHYESFLQYYGDLLAFYESAMAEHGVDLPLIVTQLGWGTVDGANLAVPATGFEWLYYTSEDEQALYVAQAYQIAQGLDYVSAIFLDNLNGCAVDDEEACFFSLEDAAGRRRPVFAAYQALPKPGDAE